MRIWRSPLVSFLLTSWLLAAGAACAAMLATAHGFETFGHLAPCSLCLRQREVYWAALALSLGGWLLTRVWRAPWLRPALCAALALVFLVGAGTAAYHAGAEWKWWPGPTACTASVGHVSAAAIANLLRGAHGIIPRCDEAGWRMAGLSMAGYNVLVSLALAALSLAAALRRAPEVVDDR